MYTGLIMSFPCKKADLMSNACTIQFFPAMMARSKRRLSLQQVGESLMMDDVSSRNPRATSLAFLVSPFCLHTQVLVINFLASSSPIQTSSYTLLVTHELSSNCFSVA